MTPKGISIHWPGYSKSLIDANPGPKLVTVIRNGHLAQGWSDIGYHYVITKDVGGSFRVYDGRPDSRQGAHTYGYNDWLGVSVAYPMGYDVPEAQLLVLAKLVAALCKKYKIPLDRAHVKGHREFPGHRSNQCPGDPLYRNLDKVVKLAAMESNPPKLPTAPKPVGDEPREEMLHPIDIEINGKLTDGFILDDHSLVPASLLAELGIDVIYVPAAAGKPHKLQLRKKV